MLTVTFQVLEGIDKGRVFRELSTPVTIGREEGNVLRLNDERISRFHAKIQFDNNDVILTDLDSTNGTRVNGSTVQIRRLRPGDRVALGRSLLLFGSDEEIAARVAALGGPSAGTVVEAPHHEDQTADQGLEAMARGGNTVSDSGALSVGKQTLPPLPKKLTPSQVARLAEIFDFIHGGLTMATDNVQAEEDAREVTLSFADWQKILAIQMILARYLRAVADPEGQDE